jgi:DEAD/DEAH box helicase domain-containing protein
VPLHALLRLTNGRSKHIIGSIATTARTARAPLSLEATIDALRTDPDLAEGFVAWRELPAQDARYAPFPMTADGRLIDALQRRGIDRLYTHQGEAFAAVMQRNNVVVVTPTASGKTLCYNLPVLQTILDDPEARALYLFPTKALAQDQMQELHGLITDLEVDIKTFTYDGDTPGDARRKVRAAGHIVVTNPDMLHTGILPHHTKWMKLFENLRYVVIDELHQYRGVFGSHVANVIRRLHRVCRFYGSEPLFICCSATIANPRELAEALVRRPVVQIDNNGAPSGRKVVAVYNPPVVNRELGIRQSSVNAARTIGERLLRAGVQTIVFAPSRVRVELLLRYLREALRQRIGEPPKVEGYRGGYLPNERRAVERGLRDGRIRGVVATNALELGVDIGGLDAAVLTGYPGTLASAWQQIGRAGRRQGLAFAAVVASSSPLNQYVASHPEYLFETPPESGLIDADNLLVRISHMKCAAFEVPFDEAALGIEPKAGGEDFGPLARELLDMLSDEGVLVKAGGRYHWMTETFPAEGVSLRSAAIDNFVIIEQGPKPRVIGEMDRPSAPLLIHDEAIYLHGGQQYHVDRLDWHEKKAYVRKVDVDYYTDANLAVDLEVLESFDRSPQPGCEAEHGEVAVREVATIFKKIKLETNENVGWGRISIPEESRHTTGYWFSLDEDAIEGLARSELQDGLWGMAHVLRHLAPMFLMCDPRDLQAVAQVRSPFTERPTLFLYENQPGGVGMAAKLFEIHAELIAAAADLVDGCRCPGGCPGCVGPSIGDHGANKRAAAVLLQRLCGRPRADRNTEAQRHGGRVGGLARDLSASPARGPQSNGDETTEARRQGGRVGGLADDLSASPAWRSHANGDEEGRRAAAAQA